jgi:prepilin-type processing-associated H-X9-DG protein
VVDGFIAARSNRDQAFAVDIVYKQTLDSIKGGLIPRSLELAAPKTDVPNTYAEWQLYVPTSQRLSGFEGSMTVQRGTTYDLRDAWRRFAEFYSDVLRDHGQAIILWGGMAVFFLALIGAAMHKGSRGVIGVLAAFMILALMAGMLLPALGKAKAKAQRVSAVNSLKQIGLAARMFAGENAGRLPNSLEEMMNELSSDKVLRDPQTGEHFVYVGAGKRADDPRMILAYSPVDINGRNVVFADGSVQQMSSARFAEAMQRDAEAMRQPAVPPLDAAQLGAVRQLQTDGLAAGDAIANGVPPPAPPAIEGTATGIPLASATPARPEAGGNRGGGGGFGAGRYSPVIGQAGVPGQVPASSTVGGVSALASLAPAVSGLRSIRIDIPRTGQAFTFTKVLNVSDEPLSVKMSVMKQKTFRILRSALQLGCFLAGLFIVWREWHRSPSRSFRFTLGLSLVIGAVVSLSIATRALHSLLILAVPLLLAALVIWLGWKLWPRRPISPAPKTQAARNTQEGSAPAASSATAMLSFVLSLSALFAGAARADELSRDQSSIDNHPSSITNTVSLLSAAYTGAVHEKVAQFDVTLVVSTIATNQTIPLFGGDVALESFATETKGAMLIRLGRGVALRLADKGTATVKLTLAVRLTRDATKRQLSFSIPPALSSKLSLSLDEPEADVEFPSAVAFKRATDREQTRVEAILGASDRVDLFWTPRMKRVGDMAASIFAQNTTLVSVGGGAINTRSVIDYQISQGELRQVKVRLPAGQRLLRVEGEWIRTWELQDAGNAQVLTVDLLKGVSPKYRLAVETERLLDKLPASVKVEVPQCRT